jgi:hypothetical protein
MLVLALWLLLFSAPVTPWPPRVCDRQSTVPNPPLAQFLSYTTQPVPYSEADLLEKGHRAWATAPTRGLTPYLFTARDAVFSGDSVVLMDDFLVSAADRAGATTRLFTGGDGTGGEGEDDEGGWVPALDWRGDGAVVVRFGPAAGGDVRMGRVERVPGGARVSISVDPYSRVYVFALPQRTPQQRTLFRYFAVPMGPSPVTAQMGWSDFSDGTDIDLMPRSYGVPWITTDDQDDRATPCSFHFKPHGGMLVGYLNVTRSAECGGGQGHEELTYLMYSRDGFHFERSPVRANISSSLPPSRAQSIHLKAPGADTPATFTTKLILIKAERHQQVRLLANVKLESGSTMTVLDEDQEIGTIRGPRSGRDIQIGTIQGNDSQERRTRLVVRVTGEADLFSLTLQRAKTRDEL